MRALGFEGFGIRVNNRLILNGLLEELGLGEKAERLLRSLDKLDKAGREAVSREMVEKANVSTAQAERVLALTGMEGANSEILGRLERDFGSNARAAEGIKRLRELLAVAAAAGLTERHLRLDLAIARGLDYYTGTVYETFLDDWKGGSVCSGGRYDNLAGLYTKQSLPGVGASLGLDRLLAAMEELNLLQKCGTPAPVLLVQFSAERLADYSRWRLRFAPAAWASRCFPKPKRSASNCNMRRNAAFGSRSLPGRMSLLRESGRSRT